MNKPIRTMSIFCMLLFAALLLNSTYLQYFEASSLNSRGDNKRVRDAEYGDESYEYDPVNRLTTVRDAPGRKVLVNTYGYLGELTSQEMADHRTLRWEYGFDDRRTNSEVVFTDDLGYVTRWMRGRDGFYSSLPELKK